MTRPPTVAMIERMTCLCGADDRQCPHCGAPFEAPGPHVHEGGPAKAGEVLAPCPRCGQPTTEANRVPVATARAMRRERGLVP